MSITPEDTSTTKRENAVLRVSMSISYPPHIERAKDPYYHVFLATRHQLVEVQKETCWRCGGSENLEAHHKIQWVFFNDIDMEKLRKDFPSFTGSTEEDKQRWLNSPENIVILCKDCHTETHGIHKIAYPLWLIRRYCYDTTPDTVIVDERARIRKAVRVVAESTGAANNLRELRISPHLKKRMIRATLDKKS